MKIFRKRKPLKDTAMQRVPFEEIVYSVLDHYKDNIICSEDTKNKIKNEIVKRIREQLPE